MKTLKRYEKEEDRLSDLPDCLLLYILSFLNTKQVVQTSILSTRWKNLWKQIPTCRLNSLPDCVLLHILSFLNTICAFRTSVLSWRWNNLWKRLSTLKFSGTTLESFHGRSKIVSRILSLRNHSTALYTLEFICDQEFVEPHTLKSIVNYAISHNVQRLLISFACPIQQFPPCLFSCQTLTSLHLSVHPLNRTFFPKSLNFPALTNLTLKFFYFGPGDDDCVEPFSTFNKLNTLTIHDCKVWNAQILSISSITLVNLTIYSYSNYLRYKLSAPSLCNFAFTGAPNQKLYGSHLFCVKHLYIDTNILSNGTTKEDSLVLLNWLLEFANIESLTVSSSTLQVLSFVPDLFKVKLTSLCNLESLTVEMKDDSPGLYLYGGLGQRASIPDEVLMFLLQNSPSATVHIIQ